MMMTSTYSQTFVLCASFPLSLKKNAIYVYPTIDENMSIAEKSYPFMETKSALKSVEIPLKRNCKYLESDCTESTSLGTILQACFLQYGFQFIRTAGNFEVLSYHSCGQII